MLLPIHCSYTNSIFKAAPDDILSYYLVKMQALGDVKMTRFTSFNTARRKKWNCTRVTLLTLLTLVTLVTLRWCL